MKMTLDELSRDPMAQRSCLRLETAPVISLERNRDVRRVFDFREAEDGGLPDISESSARRVLPPYKPLELEYGKIRIRRRTLVRLTLQQRISKQEEERSVHPLRREELSLEVGMGMMW